MNDVYLVAKIIRHHPPDLVAQLIQGMLSGGNAGLVTHVAEPCDPTVSAVRTMLTDMRAVCRANTIDVSLSFELLIRKDDLLQWAIDNEFKVQLSTP